MNLVLISPEGLVMTNEKPSEVEEHQEEPLHIIAARAAEKQSTPSKEIK